MPARLTVFLALVLFQPAAAQQGPLGYAIDLNDRADDRFKVTAWVSGLTEANAIYQFAATAPGTYQVMDIGRYVRGFQAFDQAGRPVPSERVSVNQWRLSDPRRVRTLRYSVAETWDTPVSEHQVYLMCGTSIEQDHVLLNPHAVIGYPAGMQARPVRLRLRYPSGWKVGTALRRDPSGAYLADDFDHLVDSPVLLGKLTEARTAVTGVPVEIYTYSRTGRIRSSELLDAMDGMLQAAGRFLGKLPVDRYTFLYHFDERPAGAWEHSLSSTYVLSEGDIEAQGVGYVTSIAAHEFFHIVTPLNIHSEIIEHFNFVTPVPSQHLWLYEGTTEWASHAMQLRSGLETLDQHLSVLAQKIQIDRVKYDSTWSLHELALHSYSDSGQVQYGNIYMRGALTAELLDIRLLELSGGQRGLQDLILDLTRRFGRQRAFPEATFVDTVVALTHPEIREFFDRYVWESERLPIAEYFGRMGIRMIEGPPGKPVRFEVDSAPLPAQRALRKAWLGRKPRPAS